MKIDKARQVYILHNKEINIIKIGISENIRARKAVLEKECGCILDLIYESEHLINPEKYEREIHNAFQQQRRIGEWFNITQESAINKTTKIVKQAIYDPLISKYKNGTSISELARTHNVTRQAVIMKLKLYGVYGEQEDVYEIHPQSEAFKVISKRKKSPKVVAQQEKDPIKNKIIGNKPPGKEQLTNLKRIEPNINSNGTWHQAFVFKNGEFINFYSKNIKEVREFVVNAK